MFLAIPKKCDQCQSMAQNQKLKPGTLVTICPICNMLVSLPEIKTVPQNPFSTVNATKYLNQAI